MPVAWATIVAAKTRGETSQWRVGLHVHQRRRLLNFVKPTRLFFLFKKISVGAALLAAQLGIFGATSSMREKRWFVVAVNVGEVVGPSFYFFIYGEDRLIRLFTLVGAFRFYLFVLSYLIFLFLVAVICFRVQCGTRSWQIWGRYPSEETVRKWGTTLVVFVSQPRFFVVRFFCGGLLKNVFV